ncbi:MAG: hypothetical protein H0V68_11245 [Actinobacteria bacterium]|nr:hypothetical protein [Actinomycetota bacterium]
MIVLLLGSALDERRPDHERPRVVPYGLLDARLPPEPNPSDGNGLVIVRSDTLTADDPAFEATRESVCKKITGRREAAHFRGLREVGGFLRSKQTEGRCRGPRIFGTSLE